MARKRTLPLVWFLSLAFVGSCQSKFHEPPPKQVDSAGASSVESLKEKAALDRKLDDIHRSGQQIQRYLTALKKVLPLNQDKSYSLIDFILEVNEKAKDTVPQKREQRQVHLVELTVQGEHLAQECHRVQVEIRSESALVDKASPEKSKEESVEYAVKTCATAGVFVPMVRAQWSNNSIKIEFGSKEISEKLFAFLLIQGIKPATACTIWNADSSDSKIECTDIVTTLSPGLNLIIRKLGYQSDNQFYFFAEYEIFQNEKIKFTGFLKIFKDGHQERDFRAVP